ncbi:50S ribosomal protein L32 [Candidatus Shapirobacteria bacterium]|nr:50S ribosomal protein L32 [Candidatus Shapirobacteria bacterium]
MTPLPKRRWSSRRQAKKRRSIKINFTSLGTCPKCGKPAKTHYVCPGCGHYRGEEVIKKVVKKKKRSENPS